MDPSWGSAIALCSHDATPTRNRHRPVTTTVAAGGLPACRAPAVASPDRPGTGRGAPWRPTAVDNTVNYIDPAEPTHGLPGLLAGPQSRLDGDGQRNFSLTLEHIDTSAATVTNETAATSFWDNSLYELASGGLSTIDGLINALNNRR